MFFATWLGMSNDGSNLDLAKEAPTNFSEIDIEGARGHLIEADQHLHTPPAKSSRA